MENPCVLKKLYVPHRLYSNPSFLGGMSSLLDLGNTLQNYNTSDTDSEADTEALKSDWRAVGDDIKTSIRKYEQLTRK